jgi:hypothetical protein
MGSKDLSGKCNTSSTIPRELNASLSTPLSATPSSRRFIELSVPAKFAKACLAAIWLCFPGRQEFRTLWRLILPNIDGLVFSTVLETSVLLVKHAPGQIAARTSGEDGGLPARRGPWRWSSHSSHQWKGGDSRIESNSRMASLGCGLKHPVRIYDYIRQHLTGSPNQQARHGDVFTDV